MTTDNPFHPPKVSVDTTAPKKRRSNWMVWAGIATPIVIVAVCSGMLMTAEDPVKKSAREAAQGGLLVEEAIPAVRLTLDDPHARVAQMMSMEGRLSNAEVKLFADVISEKIPGVGSGRATIYFRQANAAPSGYEVSRVLVGGINRQFKPGEAASLQAAPQP